MSTTTNSAVRIVSSSKLPPASKSAENLRVDGYVCTMVTAGEDVSTGELLRPSTTVNRTAIRTTSSSDLHVIGVAVESALSGEQVCMAIGGEFQILVTGSVDRGDFLAASSTTGVAESTGTSGDTGDFAIAMATDANTGTKLVHARFLKAEVY